MYAHIRHYKTEFEKEVGSRRTTEIIAGSRQSGIVEDELVTDGEEVFCHGLLRQACEGGASRFERPVGNRWPCEVKWLVLQHQVSQEVTPLVSNTVRAGVARLEFVQPRLQVMVVQRRHHGQAAHQGLDLQVRQGRVLPGDRLLHLLHLDLVELVPAF